LARRIEKGDNEAKNLLAEVQEESRRFDEFILLPEAEYQKAYATVWPRLTDLNRRLESIE
jgi:hypothetical protein